MPEKKGKSLNAGNNSIVIGGNVQDSNIILGDKNTVLDPYARLGELFKKIAEHVDLKTTLPSSEKADLKAELQEVQAALEEPNPDETFLARRFRNVKRMAPEIVEVAFETLKNPIGGVAEVIKRVAAKMAEEAGS